MNKPLDDLLDIDPVDIAEKICTYNKDVGPVALGLHLRKNQLVTEALSELGDVNGYSQTLQQYIETIEKYGFELALKEEIVGTPDHLYVYWLDGMLLVFDSYCGRSVNGGRLYFNYAYDKADEMGPRALSGCSHSVRMKLDDRWFVSGDVDCLQALFHRIQKFKEAGEIMSVWKHQPFLWILNYMDTKNPNYDYKELNRTRISKLPQHIQDAIGPYVE